MERARLHSPPHYVPWNYWSSLFTDQLHSLATYFNCMGNKWQQNSSNRASCSETLYQVLWEEKHNRNVLINQFRALNWTQKHTGPVKLVPCHRWALTSRWTTQFCTNCSFWILFKDHSAQSSVVINVLVYCGIQYYGKIQERRQGEFWITSQERTLQGCC